MFLLLIGTFSAIYVDANQIDKDTITINGQELTIDQIFSIVESKTIETDGEIKSGVSLEDLITKVGISCTSCSKYTFKAKDGYQQTVDFETLKSGILTNYSRVYFPDTAHALWVRDVIEIEVS
jgi:hypothetical protein